MKKAIVLKTALFLIVFGIAFATVYKIIVSHDDYRNYQWIAGFYNEKEDSLDAVYIGGSNVYAFWEAPIAWHESGITVYPFTCQSQPLVAAQYLLKEVRKTQPNALYIISVNGLHHNISDIQIHYMTDYMPYSLNRFQLINAICDAEGVPFSKRLEFYFPFIRFHSRWEKLSKNDFHYENNGLKGGSLYDVFLDHPANVADRFTGTTRREKLPDFLEKSLKNLLDYCDEENVQALFVIAPWSRPNESYWAEINTVNDYVQSRGYPCLNMVDYIEEMGLDFTTDYYNGEHTNVHGALKTTKFLAEYLVKNYGFKDKRGEAEYSDWDSAYQGYIRGITPYVLDIETNYEKRDYTLQAPKLNSVTVNGTKLTVSWDESKGAEGYRVYRKEEKSPWKMIGTVDGETLRYIDKNCKKDTTYTYTVVPWHMADGERAWGRFNIKGIKAKALLNAPTLVSLVKTNDGVKITWKKVKAAGGYKVYRRLPGKNWIMLKDAENTDSYIDTAVLDNLPFCYTVRGYTVNEEDEKINGSQNPKGLLYLPELTMPTVVNVVNNGEVTLSWDPAEGMNGYKVYRNEELIAELPDSATKFSDKPGNGRYKYRVEAFFKFGSDVYTFNLNNAFEWVDCK